jgi:hypothetical protein
LEASQNYSKSCTDLCQKCQEFAGKISKSGNITEEEKELLLTEYNRNVRACFGSFPELL